MITRDYHGFTVADALADAERFVSVTRMKRRTVDVEFITGHGVIQTELMNKLTELSLSPSIKLGNDGVVVCTIE